VRADDPAVREFLASSFVARVATRSRSGAPALTPLWFVADGGRLFMATGRETLAARNARACPEIAVLLDGEAAGPRERVLLLRGSATVRDAMPSWRVMARMAWKYYVGGAASELRHAGLWRLRGRYYGQAQAAVIEFLPEQASWTPAP
jgi:nitroimidazol reductase NimA-like FMN-containing flavoprotein (pyridoxamine 5'-phosphate oxidase superfamily)